MELSNLLNQKKGEFERNNIELESMLKVVQEQKLLIDKLSNNET